MIEERLLADPAACPECWARLTPGASMCTRCSLPLRGPLAARVWAVSMDAARLLETRRDLLRQLRATAESAQVPPVPRPAREPAPPRPGPEWSRKRVQNLLLGLGVLLLAVAAVIFVAVSWGHLGVAGRAAVMLGVTALAAAAAASAHRRGLAATAEWLSGLTVALALLDAFALRRAGFADVDAMSGSSYWAGAFALLALAAALGSWPLPTRALRLSAAVLGQLPIPVVTLDRAGIPDAVGFGAQTVLVLLAVTVLRRAGAARDARLVLTGCAPLWWLCAFVAAVTAGYPDGSAELFGLAGIAASAAWLFRGRPALRHAAAGASAAAALTGALVAAREVLPAAWLPAAAAGLALAVLGALVAFGRQWRPGPVAVCTAVAFLAFAQVLDAIFIAVAGPLTWLAEPWSGWSGGGARELLAADLDGGPAWAGGPEVPVVLLLAVAAVPVLAARLLAVSWLRPSGVAALTAAALVTLPPALDLPYPLAVGWDLVLGAGLTCGGLLVIRRDRVADTQHVAAVVAGAVLVGVALAWSLATPAVTIGAFGAGLLVAVAATWSAPAPARPVPAALAVGLACAETAACTRWSGGTVADTGLAVAVVAAVLAAIGVIAAQRGPDRLLNRLADRRQDRVGDRVAAAVAGTAAAGYLTGLVLAYPQAGGFALAVGAGLAAALTVCGLVRPRYGDGVAAGLACAQVAALARWIWAEPVTVAFSLALAAAVLGAVSAWLARPDAVLASASGYAMGTVALLGEPDRLWLALLAGGVAAGVVAARPAYRRAAWVSMLLLVASSWVRLALAGVTAPEAYTAPAGLVLLAVGHLRRRSEEEVRSWPAYGPGLGLVLLPSLVVAVTDPGLARPLLLGLAALVVLLAGLTRRLAAPLVLGGLTLAVDVVVQLAPSLAAVYDALPRWVAFAAAGLLLVVLGATYENRVRDLRRLQRGLERMH